MMQYRLQLDTKNQLFVAIDAHDQNHFGTGRTVEEAIKNLKDSTDNKAAQNQVVDFRTCENPRPDFLVALIFLKGSW